jgi:hypothetical protein
MGNPFDITTNPQTYNPQQGGYNQAPGLGQQGVNLGNSLINEGNQGPQALTSQYMQGTNTANAQDNSHTQSANNQQMGGFGFGGMQDAIQNKQAMNFAKGQGQLQSHMNMQGLQNSITQQLQATNSAVNIANMERGVNTQNQSLQIAMDSARYGTMASILQGTGSIAGAVYGGKNAPNNQVSSFEAAQLDSPTQVGDQFNNTSLSPDASSVDFNPDMGGGMMDG